MFCFIQQQSEHAGKCNNVKPSDRPVQKCKPLSASSHLSAIPLSWFLNLSECLLLACSPPLTVYHHHHGALIILGKDAEFFLQKGSYFVKLPLTTPPPGLVFFPIKNDPKLFFVENGPLMCETNFTLGPILKS